MFTINKPGVQIFISQPLHATRDELGLLLLDLGPRVATGAEFQLRWAVDNYLVVPTEASKESPKDLENGANNVRPCT